MKIYVILFLSVLNWTYKTHAQNIDKQFYILGLLPSQSSTCLFFDSQNGKKVKLKYLENDTIINRIRQIKKIRFVKKHNRDCANCNEFIVSSSLFVDRLVHKYFKVYEYKDEFECFAVYDIDTTKIFNSSINKKISFLIGSYLAVGNKNKNDELELNFINNYHRYLASLKILKECNALIIKKEEITDRVPHHYNITFDINDKLREVFENEYKYIRKTN